MLKKHRLLFSALAIVAVALSAWFFSSPLRRPESSIRASLLRSTPLGSSSHEVRAFVKSQGWTEGPVGVTSIQGDLGHYRSLPFQTYVTALWSFDTDDHLIDVRVEKTVDGL